MGFEWDPRLEMGVAGIDQQHREIFRRLGGMLGAMAERRGKAEVAPLVEFMSGYFVEHFRAEEQLMISRGYPAYAPHKAEHDRFARAFEGFRDEYQRNGSTVVTVLRVARNLTDLFRDHINVTDRKLAAFIRGAGG